MWWQESFRVQTEGRGTYDVTSDVARLARASGVTLGLCHVFVQHTSAGLMLCENADPTVRRDLEAFMSRVVPDGDPLYKHTAEGPDDMPAHVRTVLTHTDVTLPVTGGRLALGTWQGLYLWEHRVAGHDRRVIVTIQGQ